MEEEAIVDRAHSQTMRDAILRASNIIPYKSDVDHVYEIAVQTILTKSGVRKTITAGNSKCYDEHHEILNLLQTSFSKLIVGQGPQHCLS
jgi:hypothetical protein